jgi:hypothetical protein
MAALSALIVRYQRESGTMMPMCRTRNLIVGLTDWMRNWGKALEYLTMRCSIGPDTVGELVSQTRNGMTSTLDVSTTLDKFGDSPTVSGPSSHMQCAPFVTATIHVDLVLMRLKMCYSRVRDTKNPLGVFVVLACLFLEMREDSR